MNTPAFDRFDCISPADYRYYVPELGPYLSENGFTQYKLRVELALARALAQRGIGGPEVVADIEAACAQVTTAEVYAEEKRIGHDIRALVNCIRDKVSPRAKPVIHMTATSFDISDTANAARFKDATVQVLIPALKKLILELIIIVRREAATTQVGRTHGQHAVPITVGFALAEYVSRLGGSYRALTHLADQLTGKFSGAVGAYNASSLFFPDPEQFETEVLTQLGLKPAEHSTQIVPPEALTRLLTEVTILAGVMANLADDMRHLQRTEIGEVGEEFGGEQVGSSTMPQKRNPIGFENIKSMWKTIVGRLITVLMDQISEHQRDLTNSASARTYPETLAYVVYMTKRLTGIMGKLKVDKERLAANLKLQQGLILAEPLYIILAGLGHPDAHEKVRRMTLEAQRLHCSLESLIRTDDELKPFLTRMSTLQRSILTDPLLYTGQATKKARDIAERWHAELTTGVSA